MDFAFETKSLTLVFEDQVKAERTLGIRVAKILRTRLADFIAAETVSDLAVGNPQEIEGLPYHNMAVELGEGCTLVFAANHVMYMAMIGDATRRCWWWAVALATFLELAMLFTPYAGFFGIKMTARFVIVTLTAHLIFGIALGLYAKFKTLNFYRPQIA